MNSQMRMTNVFDNCLISSIKITAGVYCKRNHPVLRQSKVHCCTGLRYQLLWHLTYKISNLATVVNTHIFVRLGFYLILTIAFVYIYLYEQCSIHFGVIDCSVSCSKVHMVIWSPFGFTILAWFLKLNQPSTTKISWREETKMEFALCSARQDGYKVKMKHQCGNIN